MKKREAKKKSKLAVIDEANEASLIMDVTDRESNIIRQKSLLLMNDGRERKRQSGMRRSIVDD